MPKNDLTVQVVTEDCVNDEVYSHEVNLKEGQSLVDIALESIESVCQLYTTKDIKSIHLYFNGDE